MDARTRAPWIVFFAGVLLIAFVREGTFPEVIGAVLIGMGIGGWVMQVWTD